jgi:ATP-binding cassette subfamily F protein uup
LLRIFAQLEKPDEGEIITRRQLRVGYVPQMDSFAEGGTALSIVADAIDHHVDEHERELQAMILLDRAGFKNVHAEAEKLSGGWKKRLAIVRALAREPDLLLMDEPTNHLDIEGIVWLEDLIEGGAFATLTVSHDRRFLEEIANRIIELGRAYPEGYLSHNGTYSEFLEKREEFLAAQQGRAQALASGVRREIAWLRRGAKARTTKAKGRIERAGEMMSELADLRQRNTQQGSAKIDFAASERKTKKLVDLKNVSKALGERKLFENLSVTLSPGTKLGLVGPNGSGKSTLIKVLTGMIEADAGGVVRAENLQVVLFDQHREQLDPGQALRRALSPMGDTLIVGGSPMHVTGWARRFLFRPDQLDLPVGELSGGEQARVLIARLMLRQADVLILDEPTNDLDIPTLDVLEESLEDFPGAVVLVTHDRYLIDRVATEVLALDGEGHAEIYAELAQWERAQEARAAAQVTPKRVPATTAAPAPAAKKRLSWKEQKELEQMEQSILAAETKVQELETRVNEPAVAADHVKAREAYQALSDAQAEVERLYARWSELEAKQG